MMKLMERYRCAVADEKIIECLEKEMFEIIQEGKLCGLSETQICNCLNEAFINNNKHDIFSIVLKKLKFFVKFCVFIGIFSFIIIIITVFILSVFHTPTQIFFRKHFDHISYPVLRKLRFWTLPLFKYLNMDFTEWHELECLVKNPFYLVTELDCWPCASIDQIPDLTGFTNFSEEYYHNAVPFIIKDGRKINVSFEIVKQLYQKHKEQILKGTTTFKSYSLHLLNLTHLLDGTSLNITEEAEFHTEWIVNRIAASQIIRQLFPRPYFVPLTTEVSLEKIIFIDGPKALPYKIPVTNFANVWVMQASGARHLVLIPTKQCAHECHTMSVELSSSDVLFYNWQFWNAKSAPAQNSSSLSISFVGSFY